MDEWRLTVLNIFPPAGAVLLTQKGNYLSTRLNFLFCFVFNLFSVSLSWDYLCFHAVRGHNLLLSEFQLSRNSHSMLYSMLSHFFDISVFTLFPVPLATRVLIPVVLILFPAPLLLWLLLSFLSTLRLAVSISALPGRPAETCNLNSKAASLRLCPEKVFLSKHYSKSYE